MTLTTEDLHSIKTIVHEELTRELTLELAPIKEDLESVKTTVKELTLEMASMKEDLESVKIFVLQELTPMKEDLASMKEDLGSMKADLVSIKDDVSLLAKLNQLDDIRKEPRLRKMYGKESQQEA